MSVREGLATLSSLSALCVCFGCGGSDGDAATAEVCSWREVRLDDGSCFVPGTQANGCRAGEVGLEGGGCRPAGIPPEQCGEGFVSDGNGSCAIELPSCPRGMMAVPGDARCRPIAPCAMGRWGDIPVDQDTQYVDRSYAGADSLGTAEKPWTTIQQGIAAATEGAIVAVADGEYIQDVAIAGKAVKLWGRCPSTVVLRGTATGTLALFVGLAAAGTEIRDIGVRSDGEAGIVVSGSQGVVIDRAWVHDTNRYGISVQDDLGPTQVVLTNSLVESVGEIGVLDLGVDLEVSGSVVRDTRPTSAGLSGRGIAIQINPVSGTRGGARIAGSLVEKSRESGVYVNGADVTIESTLIRATDSQEAEGSGGQALSVQPDYAGIRSSASVRSSIFERSHTFGAYVIGSDVTLEASVFRDTEPRVADQRSGRGIEIDDDIDTGFRSNGVIRSCVVERNHDIGIFIAGSDVLVEASIVRDMRAQAADAAYGYGVTVTRPLDTDASAHSSVVGSVVERSLGVAMVTTDSLTVDGTIVRSTSPLASSGLFGDGLLAGLRGSASVSASVIEANTRAGISNFGSTVALGTSAVLCNPIALAGETFENIAATYEDLGLNICGCNDTAIACHVQSASLEPPDLPAPDAQ